MNALKSPGPKLRDAAILVAATALGFALSRMSTASLNESTFRENPFWIFVVMNWSGASAYFIAPMFVMWSAAVVVMGLISPGFSRIRQGPGWVGAVAVSIVVLTTSAAEIACRWLIPSNGRAMAADVLRNWDQTGSRVLAAAWVSLWLASAWHPSPAWPDRLGRWLGWAWIALGVLWHGTIFAHAVARYWLRLM